MAATRTRLLLVEPDSLLRRTVAGVSRDLDLADVHEASSIDTAARLLESNSYGALLLALDADGHALTLLERLRNGGTCCAGDIPAAAMAEACDAGLALRLRELKALRLLLKPFKVKGVLETVAALAAAG